MEDKREPTLSDTLNRLAKTNERLEELLEQKEIRRWKIPFRARVGKKNIKKNWVSIMYIQNNGGARFLKARIKEGVVIIDDIPHVVSNDYIILYKNRPIIIVPEWSIEPFNPKADFDQANKDKRYSIGWRILANYLEAGGLKEKRKLGPIVWILFILLVVGAVAYYFFKARGGNPLA